MMRVLAVNAGSSTLKLRVISGDDHFEASLDLDPWDGTVEQDGRAAWLHDHGAVDAVGHRIVHGGDRYTGPVRI
ncbi:MAG: acetate/propionate family kinase, partial [Acidimicrobiales bacterium]